MKLAPNPFTHAIAAGEKQIGIWSSLANGFAAEVISTDRHPIIYAETPPVPGAPTVAASLAGRVVSLVPARWPLVP